MPKCGPASESAFNPERFRKPPEREQQAQIRRRGDLSASVVNWPVNASPGGASIVVPPEVEKTPV